MKALIMALIAVVLIAGCTTQTVTNNQNTSNDVNNNPAVVTENITPPTNQTIIPTAKGNTITVDSKDDSGVVYSHLSIELMPGAIPNDAPVKITSMAATKNDKFIGGAYYLTPKYATLNTPAIVSITLTPEAFALYSRATTNAEFTLSYFDSNTYQYVPIDSYYDSVTHTVTANVSTFYGGGIMVVKK